MAPGIYGFDRMVVRLEDFDAGLTAYSNLFGEPRDVGTNDQMGLQMAFFDLPNGGSIEVVAPTSPESVLRAALDKSGAGMNLISFQCDDLAGTIAMMKENGVRVIEDDPTHIMVHPKSTHGVLMQLVEKPANASRRNKAAQVPDTSGVTGIVSFKCCVIFVKDTKAAIASYERLGLRLTFEFENKAAGIVQAGFFLKGGGLIELIGPVDADNIDDPFVKIMAERGEGFEQLSLDGSAGAVDVLNAKGIKTRSTDPEHTDIHRSATLTPKKLLQLNPVMMGTDEQVELGGDSAAKL